MSYQAACSRRRFCGGAQMEAQRRELFAQWEAKVSTAQEAAEAAKAAHQADREAVQLAATQALASANGKSAAWL